MLEPCTSYILASHNHIWFRAMAGVSYSSILTLEAKYSSGIKTLWRGNQQLSSTWKFLGTLLTELHWGLGHSSILAALHCKALTGVIASLWSVSQGTFKDKILSQLISFSQRQKKNHGNKKYKLELENNILIFQDNNVSSKDIRMYASIVK